MPFKVIIAICGVAGLILLILYLRTTGTSVDVSCDDFIKQEGAVSEEAEVDEFSDFVTVSLCSNPTTGFEWELTEVTDQTVLIHEGNEYISPETQGVEGAAGKEVWTFKVLKAGSSNISMEYGRSWEDSKKTEWIFFLTVVVK